ncbi:hypothetical protein [Erwinia aphidicola]|uniref:hypothetical protein n=1 Tax=Erwinia aphidicola TaxID=68334 RepID=UPI003AFA5043
MRSEPNLEFIAQLKPDLIVYSQNYGPHAQQLQKIAPKMELTFINEEGQPPD